MSPENETYLHALVRTAEWRAGGKGPFTLGDFVDSVVVEFDLPTCRNFFILRDKHGDSDVLDMHRWAYWVLRQQSWIESSDGVQYQAIKKAAKKKS